MKLIRNIHLYFKQGNSDKVYEVELCKVGDRQYTVNFRYGRRGKSLREGTKTDSPVDLAKAEAIYDKLVAAKIAKGYRTTLTDDESASSITPPPIDNSARNQAIINRLRQELNTDWHSERVIWRVGELGLAAAIPAVLEYVGRNPLCDYCIAWTIGRCQAAEGLPVLEAFCRGEFNYKLTPECRKVRRMALYALLEIIDEQSKSQLITNLKKELPDAMVRAMDSGSHEKIFYELTAYLNDNDYRKFEIIDTLYAINSAAVRDCLHLYFSSVELKPNAFQAVRHVYKMSEFRKDSRFWALLTYRFEKSKAMYNSPSYIFNNQFYLPTGNYDYKQYKTEDLKTANTELAFSSKTKAYLVRRSWRFLKKTGLEREQSYTELATDLLLQYRDEDAIEPQCFDCYKYDENWNCQVNSSWRDRYAYFFSFNYILYANSPRYQISANAKSWVCKKNYKPGDAIPPVREEAFPHLWDSAPEKLSKLLQKSKCEEVHHFAAKALKENKGFIAGLDRELLLTFLGAAYEVTAQFAYNIIKETIPEKEWDNAILRALLKCRLDEARKKACSFIELKRSEFINNAEILLCMITSKDKDVRNAFKQLVDFSQMKDETFIMLIGKMLPLLRDLAQTESPNLTEVTQLITDSLSRYFKLIDMPSIIALAESSALELQALGAAILVKQQLNAAAIPDELLNHFLESDAENIRILAVKLLSQFSDQELLTRDQSLVSLFVQKEASLRTETRPVIVRLASADSEFASKICEQFSKMLLRGRLNKDALASIRDLLTNELKPTVDKLETKEVLRFLKSKIAEAQQVGEQQFERINAEELELSEIVSLANHGLIKVRRRALAMLKAAPERLKAEMMTAVKVLDVQWEDVQQEILPYFRETFTDDDFSADTLILICDSVYEQTQLFGRELLMHYFNKKDGLDYLLKLSEHPGSNMQLFVSSFLFNYAAGDPERLRQLFPFIKRSLLQVNRGRTIKKRIFDFLNEQAKISSESASAIVCLLAELSNSTSVETKSACLEIMVAVKRRFPELKTPLKTIEPEVRRAI